MRALCGCVLCVGVCSVWVCVYVGAHVHFSWVQGALYLDLCPVCAAAGSGKLKLLYRNVQTDCGLALAQWRQLMNAEGDHLAPSDPVDVPAALLMGKCKHVLTCTWGWGGGEKSTGEIEWKI